MLTCIQSSIICPGTSAREGGRCGHVSSLDRTPQPKLCFRSVARPAPDLGEMFNMRSDIGIRRSAKTSRFGDVFGGFEMYIGKEPRGLGSDDDLWR